VGPGPNNKLRVKGEFCSGETILGLSYTEHEMHFQMEGKFPCKILQVCSHVKHPPYYVLGIHFFEES
jgi:hypothetical protein